MRVFFRLLSIVYCTLHCMSTCTLHYLLHTTSSSSFFTTICRMPHTILLCILSNYIEYCIAHWILYCILACILHYIFIVHSLSSFLYARMSQETHIELFILPNYVAYCIAYWILYCILDCILHYIFHSTFIVVFSFTPVCQMEHHITLHIAKLHWVLHISLHIALCIEYHVIYSSRPYVAGNAPYYFAYCIAYCSCLLFADEHSREDEETNADDAKQAV